MTDKPARPWRQREMWLGFAMVMACHVVWLLNPMLFTFLWFVQLAYIVPGVSIALILKRRAVMHGMLLAGAFTFVCNTILCTAAPEVIAHLTSR